MTDANNNNSYDNDLFIRDDPRTLLEFFDPAAVMIRASHDPSGHNTLEQLREFAQNLTYWYVKLASSRKTDHSCASTYNDNDNKNSQHQRQQPMTGTNNAVIATSTLHQPTPAAAVTPTMATTVTPKQSITDEEENEGLTTEEEEDTDNMDSAAGDEGIASMNQPTTMTSQLITTQEEQQSQMASAEEDAVMDSEAASDLGDEEGTTKNTNPVAITQQVQSGESPLESSDVGDGGIASSGQPTTTTTTESPIAITQEEAHSEKVSTGDNDEAMESASLLYVGNGAIASTNQPAIATPVAMRREWPDSEITNDPLAPSTRLGRNNDIDRVDGVTLAGLAADSPITPVQRLEPLEEEYEHGLGAYAMHPGASYDSNEAQSEWASSKAQAVYPATLVEVVNRGGIASSKQPTITVAIKQEVQSEGIASEEAKVVNPAASDVGDGGIAATMMDHSTAETPLAVMQDAQSEKCFTEDGVATDAAIHFTAETHFGRGPSEENEVADSASTSSKVEDSASPIMDNPTRETPGGVVQDERGPMETEAEAVGPDALGVGNGCFASTVNHPTAETLVTMHDVIDFGDSAWGRYDSSPPPAPTRVSRRKNKGQHNIAKKRFLLDDDGPDDEHINNAAPAAIVQDLESKRGPPEEAEVLDAAALNVGCEAIFCKNTNISTAVTAVAIMQNQQPERRSTIEAEDANPAAWNVGNGGIGDVGEPREKCNDKMAVVEAGGKGAEAKSIQQQGEEKQPAREPRVLRPGHRGKLVQSQLRRSVGHSRKVLNQHLDHLGLSANFAMTVVSKRGYNVSHMTLSDKWNDVPYDTNETLEWWLGEGGRRLSLALPLCPKQQKEESKQGVPVFWAATNRGRGGALCHYIGHYRCVNFEKQSIVVKRQLRQALLEFEFVNFDETLNDKLETIGEFIGI